LNLYKVGPVVEDVDAIVIGAGEVGSIVVSKALSTIAYAGNE
jgi:hypothetical protein